MRRLSLTGKALRIALGRDGSISYFPEEARRSRFAILKDFVAQAVLEGQLDGEYFLYGLDLKRNRSISYPRKRELMGLLYRQVKGQGAEEQARLLNDKARFARRLELAGFPTPPLLAIIRNGHTELQGGAHVETEAFLQEVREPIFVKPIGGAGGSGAILIERSGDGLMANRHAVELDELVANLPDGALVQRVVEQHPDLARFNPSALNTLRIVTALREGKCSPLGAFLRFGSADAITDNFSSMGVAVPVSMEHGSLLPPGYFRSAARGRTARHPDSGVEFAGFRVPYFEKCIETVVSVHRSIGGLVSVGWDVAVTPDGPTVMEGNVYWMARFHIASDPDFLRRYVQVVEPWLQPSDMRWAGRFLVG